MSESRYTSSDELNMIVLNWRKELVFPSLPESSHLTQTDLDSIRHETTALMTLFRINNQILHDKLNKYLDSHYQLINDSDVQNLFDRWLVTYVVLRLMTYILEYKGPSDELIDLIFNKIQTMDKVNAIGFLKNTLNILYFKEYKEKPNNLTIKDYDEQILSEAIKKLKVITPYSVVDLHHAIEMRSVKAVNYLIEHNIPINAEINGETALSVACKGDDIEIVKILVGHGAHVNHVDPIKKGTPLHRAIENGNKKIVNLLIEAGADLYRPNERGLIAYEIAFILKFNQICNILRDELIRDKYKIRYLQTNNVYCFPSSLEKNDTYGITKEQRVVSEVTKQLLLKLKQQSEDTAQKLEKYISHFGATYDDIKDKWICVALFDKINEQLPILTTSSSNSFSILFAKMSELKLHDAATLLKRICKKINEYKLNLLEINLEQILVEVTFTPLNKEITRDNVSTIFFNAIEGGRIDVLREMLRNDSIYKLRIFVGDKKLLNRAIKAGHLDIVQCLIEHGLDLHEFDTNPNINKPIFEALIHNRLDIFKYIIRLDRSVIYSEFNGLNLFMFALRLKGRVPFSNFMLDNNLIDLDLVSADKKLPVLFDAIDSGHTGIVKKILQKVDQANRIYGEISPLNFAINNMNSDMVALLLNQGANITRTDRNGNNPLSIAKHNSTLANTEEDKNIFNKIIKDIEEASNDIKNLQTIEGKSLHLAFKIHFKQGATSSDKPSIQSITFHIPHDYYNEIARDYIDKGVEPNDAKTKQELILFNLLFKNNQSKPPIAYGYHGNNIATYEFYFTAQHPHPRRILNLLKGTLDYIQHINLPVSQPDLAQLNHLIAHYTKQVQAKPHAKNVRYRSDFKTKAGTSPHKSHNPTIFAEKQRSKTKINETHEFVVKGRVGGTGGAVSEWESLLAERYRLINGVDRHPKAYPLINKAGEHAGVASRVLPGFVSLKDEFEKRGRKGFSVQECVDAGFGYVLAAMFINEESDGHASNLGFVNGKLVKIDDDRSAWSITRRYLHAIIGNEFKITPETLSAFPILQKSTHRHFKWLISDDFAKYFDFKLTDLQKNKEFRRQVFHTFLKEILIPDNVDAAMSGEMSSKNREQQALHFFKDKKDTLKSTLVNMREFKEFLQENPNVINDILKEFETYNSSVQKKRPHLMVKLDEVKQQYDQYLNVTASSQYNIRSGTLR